MPAQVKWIPPSAAWFTITRNENVQPNKLPCGPQKRAAMLPKNEQKNAFQPPITGRK
jgi:hypothetical protein